MGTYGYEMFVGMLRKSSPREQAEIWRGVIGRSYAHERASLLKQLLRIMDKENPQELRQAWSEFREERAQTAPPQQAPR